MMAFEAGSFEFRLLELFYGARRIFFGTSTVPLPHMKDVILLVSSIIGGAFLGYLAAIIAFFVWSLIKEGLGNPKQLAVPALILLSWFGIGLAGLTGIVFQSWPMLLGATITFTHGARLIFKPEQGASD